MSAAILATRALGAAINVVVALIGIRAARALVDEARMRMAAENRGPTDAELERLIARIEARSAGVQAAGEGEAH